MPGPELEPKSEPKPEPKPQAADLPYGGSVEKKMIFGAPIATHTKVITKPYAPDPANEPGGVTTTIHNSWLAKIFDRYLH